MQPLHSRSQRCEVSAKSNFSVKTKQLTTSLKLKKRRCQEAMVLCTFADCRTLGKLESMRSYAQTLKSGLAPTRHTTINKDSGKKRALWNHMWHGLETVNHSTAVGSNEGHVTPDVQHGLAPYKILPRRLTTAHLKRRRTSQGRPATGMTDTRYRVKLLPCSGSPSVTAPVTLTSCSCQKLPWRWSAEVPGGESIARLSADVRQPPSTWSMSCISQIMSISEPALLPDSSEGAIPKKG